MIGHLSWGLKTLIDKIKPGFGKTLTQIIYTLAPDLENFNFKTEIVHDLPIPPQIFFYSTLYWMAYTLFILILALIVFRKRDFI